MMRSAAARPHQGQNAIRPFLDVSVDQRPSTANGLAHRWRGGERRQKRVANADT